MAVTNKKDNGGKEGKKPTYSSRFKAGESGNPKGRPKGSVNKVGTEVKNMIAEALESQFKNLNDILNELDPKDRIKAMTDLAKFIVPTMRSVDAKVDGEITNVVTRFEVTYKNKEGDNGTTDNSGE